jgi:hypothetical protein
MRRARSEPAATDLVFAVFTATVHQSAPLGVGATVVLVGQKKAVAIAVRNGPASLVEAR